MRHLRLLLWLLVLLPVLGAPALAQQAGTALVIGNASYPDAGAPLPHAIADATAIADELRRIKFSVELKKNLRKQDLRSAIDTFVDKIGKDSSVVFYFSGFGLQVGRQSYLLPVDAQIWSDADVRRDGISVDSLVAEMHRKGADVKIVIVDAARRNPFERRLRAAAAGLAPVDAPVGTLVVYSAALGKMVDDRSSGGTSLFAGELLKELPSPNLNVEQIFNKVRIEVSRASRGEQVPWVASSLLGEYRLGGKTPEVPAATASNKLTPPVGDSESRFPAASQDNTPFREAARPQQSSPSRDFPPAQRAVPGPAAEAVKAARMTVTVNVGELNDKRGLLGVKVAGLSDELARSLGLESAHGAFVTSVLPNSPAAQAGIAPADVVVDFDGRNISSWQELPAIVGSTPPGSKARATLWRVASSLRELTDRLQRRAETGDDGAAYALAWLNLSENGTLQDDAAAARWAKKAADDGHAEASYLLGLLYSRGHGVAKDESEAVRLFRRAADKNNADGMYALAGMYLTGKGISKDAIEARHWYQKAADEDHAAAMAELGQMYANGTGVNKDATTAVSWYRKAADKNNAVAIASLGWMYESGQGVTQDYAQAARWYYKAAEFNNPAAYYRLGAMAETGHGVPKDETEAANWYRKAVNLDYTFAMVALGLLYENGRGVRRDAEEALRLFKKAGDKGNAAGMFYVGLSYERDKDLEKAVGYYADAARMGDTAAMHNLGVAYDRGRGINEDRRLAAEWIFKAIKAGSLFSAKQMADNPSAYSVDLRRNLQRMLSDAGVYDGPTNGRVTPAFKDAVETLAKRAKSG
jgi:TPR repeat protein